MKTSEVIEKLRAYLKCQRLQVKGIYEDCNNKLCDNCDLCYAQGTFGEHIKSIEIAIQALDVLNKEYGEAMLNEDNDLILAIQNQQSALRLLDNEPTTYSVDKVVEELNELDVKAIKRYKGGTFGNYEGTDYYIKKVTQSK